MMVRLLVVLSVSLFVLGSSISFVTAQTVGISPGNHNYEDVLRGGYAERPFTITVNSDEPIEVFLEPSGEIARWLTLPANSSFVSRDNPWLVDVAVEPPRDIPNGNYSGFLRVRTNALGSEGPEGHASGTIIAVLDVALNVGITDIERIACDARTFSVTSVEQGDDLLFHLEFLNRGNVRLQPRIIVDLWNQDQTRIVETVEFVGDEVLPTQSEDVTFRIPTDDLDTDQYWADVQAVDCFDSTLLTLDVFEPGSLKANGVLREIIAPVWTDVDETVALFVIFENTGEKEVAAQFRGQITLNDAIVQVLESERLSTSIDELTNFTFFFTPREEGRYIMSGRVFYDTKRTFESSKVINVRGKELTVGSVLLFFAYAVIFALIAFLFFKIRRERRRYFGR